AGYSHHISLLAAWPAPGDQTGPHAATRASPAARLGRAPVPCRRAPRERADRLFGRLHMSFEGEAFFAPPCPQRGSQGVDVGIGMLRAWRKPQALAAARDRRVVDGLHINAKALEQGVGDALGE